ncbi:MAG: hypothetical protein ACHQ7M_18985, partial [Chloroflexota bacterium]
MPTGPWERGQEVDRINTLKIAKTDAEIEYQWRDGEAIGFEVQHDGEGRVWFHTTQPEARVCTDLEVGDRVVIIAMGDNGALGQGSTYIGEIED